MTKLETIDESGKPVCTSMYGSIYRGVEVIGDDKPLTGHTDLPRPREFPKQPHAQAKVHVPGGLAHTYTECAQIWNPIHTDIKVARDAGLPELILHGTATLALAVSRIVHSEAGGDPITCRAHHGAFQRHGADALGHHRSNARASIGHRLLRCVDAEWRARDLKWRDSTEEMSIS